MRTLCFLLHAWSFLPIFVLIAGASISGCNQGAGRTAVSGSVRMDGEPVQVGQVAFEPVNGGKMEFAIIKDGHYSLPQEYGLVPGEYIVRITGDRPTGAKAKEDAFLKEEDDVSMEIYEQFIPAQFNTASTLRIEVKSTDTMEQDFDLSSK